MPGNHDQTTRPVSARPSVDAVLFDTTRNRIGLVVDASGETVSLRPPGHGEPWSAQLADLAVVSPAEEVRAKVIDFNERRSSRPGRL